MLDWGAMYKLMKKNGFDTKSSYPNILRISLALLDSEEKLSEVEAKGLSRDYADAVVDIWRPKPEGEEKIKQKDSYRQRLPELFKLVAPHIGSLKESTLLPQLPMNYDIVAPYFRDLERAFSGTLADMQSKALPKSNPFLTISIKESFNEGVKFQISAKVASSVETKWGNWIQGIMPLFNPSVIPIGAGGFDCILNNSAYDIKSGPNVMNKDQVEEAKQKRVAVRALASRPEFKGLVSVNDFKVAISYGKRSLAEMFMQEQSGLIIFGADAWKEITRDEWNAFKLFLWQLRFKMRSNPSAWNKESILSSIEHYIDSFYDDFDAKLEQALCVPEYLELEKLLSSVIPRSENA